MNTLAYTDQREQHFHENNALRGYRDEAQFEYALLHNLALNEPNTHLRQRLEAEAAQWYGQYLAANAALINTAPFPQGGQLTMNGRG